jgi:hypothetical protein
LVFIFFQETNAAANTISVPEITPAGIVVGYYGPAPMDLSAVKVKKITPEEFKRRRREGGLCMYCKNSRHCAMSCPRKLKAVSE